MKIHDKELVIQIAREGNLAESFVLESGEYACSTNSFLFNLDLYAGAAYTNSLPISDQLYLVQYNVIKELAGKGPCVIVGRCADYVLRDRNDCLHTFFHADAAFRADRIVGVYGETHENPEKRLKEKDEKRKIYYKHYTGRQWGIAQNYHISLDSGEIGIQQSVDIVVNLVKASL